MKHAIKILMVMVFCVLGIPAHGQLYRLILDSTDFKVVSSGTASNATIVTNFVASARYIKMNTGKLLGRSTAGVGLIEELSTVPAANFPALTGDVTTSAGSLATTLAAVGAGGTSTKVTFNTKGLVTSGTTADLSGSDVTGILGAGRFPALTGDITTIAGALATTLKNTGTPGTYTSVTTDAQGRVTSGSNPTTQTTLDQVLAAVASSAVNHAGNTNQWRWTDAGLLKASFTLKASQTTATSIGFNISEFAAATGGAGSQDLLRINTLAGSTANPFHVLNQGTNVLDIYGPTGQMLAGNATGNPDLTFPVYSFLLGPSYGIDLATGGYMVHVISGSERFRVDSTGVKTSAGSVGSPAYSFTSSSSSGTYSPFTGTVGWSGGGVLGGWVTNSVFHTTNLWINLVAYTWPTAQGGASTVLQNNGSGVLTWTAPSSGAALSGITAASADNNIQNGAFNQVWRFTDPGAAEINFSIQGTNSTASTTFDVAGQMTSATAVFSKIRETVASTGGSGSQYLASIGTLASSTATPLHVESRATTVFDISYNTAQILAASGSTTVPTYGFSARSTSGMLYSSGPQMQYDSSHYFQAQNDTLWVISGNSFARIGDTLGVSITAANGATELNTGDSSDPGLSYRSRIIVSSSGTVTLTSAVGTGTDRSGLVYVATGSVTYAFPASPTVGDVYTVVFDAGSGTVTLEPDGASQTLRIGSQVTTANTGVATTTVRGSSVTFVYSSSNTWIAISYTGTWVAT